MQQCRFLIVYIAPKQEKMKVGMVFYVEFKNKKIYIQGGLFGMAGMVFGCQGNLMN